MTAMHPWGISRKLLALALANALALALLAGIVWIASGRIGSLSTTISEKEMALVLDSAALGRDLSATLSELDRTTRDCQTRHIRLQERDKIGVQLDSLARAATDRGLADSIEGLAATTHRERGVIPKRKQMTASRKQKPASMRPASSRIARPASRRDPRHPAYPSIWLSEALTRTSAAIGT
jgi:hypothetical protein